MEVIQYYITRNECYKNNIKGADSRYTTFQARGPLGLMLHSIGTPQPSAKVIANYENQRGVSQAVHGILQPDGTVYQTLPWNFRGWHAGGSANNTHVGVEMSEPDTIKYIPNTATFTIDPKDVPAAQEFCRKNYATAVELFASLCKSYNLDPLKCIISHSEGHKMGIASNHADPEHIWRQLELPFTMDTFREDVKKKIEEETPPVERATVRNGSKGPDVEELQKDLNVLGYNCGAVDGKFGKNTEAAVKSFQKDNGLTVYGIVGKKTWAAIDERLAELPNENDEIYRVRKTWEDVKSQIGAFEKFENAKRACDKAGYEYAVYNDKGHEEYRPEKPFEEYDVRVLTLLNIRESYTVNSKILGTLKKGTVVTIVSQKDSWGKLKDRDGWISLKYTKLV